MNPNIARASWWHAKLIVELKYIDPRYVPDGTRPMTDEEVFKFKNLTNAMRWIASACDADLRRSMSRTLKRPPKKKDMKEARSWARRHMAWYAPSRTRTMAAVVPLIS